jgi:hypothetical protein
LWPVTYLSGTVAHHQNGVAERAIRTIVNWSRAMLLHMVIHWPTQADLALWPFAMEYATYIWNHLPRKGLLLSPVELLSRTKFRTTSYDVHAFGVVPRTYLILRYKMEKSSLSGILVSGGDNF